MGVKYLTVLGINTYQECTYQLGEHQETSRYIQEALIKILIKKGIIIDEIVVFLTDRAKKENWEQAVTMFPNRFKKEFCKKYPELVSKITPILEHTEYWNDSQEPSPEFGLKSILETAFPKIPKKDITIQEGKTTEELWEIYQSILDSVQEGDEIIFDLTHGFRTIPMLAIVALDCLRKNKKVKVSHLLYGAYDAREVETNIAPVFDVTMFLDIMDWSHALYTFDEFGTSAPVYELGTREIKIINQNEDNRNNYKSELKRLKKFVGALNIFSKTMDTCRGRYIENKKEQSISAAAINLLLTIEEVELEQNSFLKPLLPMVASIKNQVGKFAQKDNLETGMQTIAWCIEKGKMQQAYTALEESIITMACRLCDVSEVGKENRQNVVSYAITSIGKENEKNRVKKNANCSEENKKITSKTVEEVKCKLKNNYMELVDLANEVKDMRNDLNHFGFTNNEMGCDNFKDNIKEKFKIFRNQKDTYFKE